MSSITREQLTVVTRVRENHTGDLYGALDDFRACLDACERSESGERAACPVCTLPGLHFFRWVVLPKRFGERGQSVEQESLVLWTVFDGAVEDHLGSLCAGPMREHLDRVYEHCDGYPTAGTAGDVKRYLRDHRIVDAAFFDGLPGWSREVVEDEDRLWGWVDDLVSKTEQWTTKDPAEIHVELKKAVIASGSFTATLARSLRRHVDQIPPDASLGARLQSLGGTLLELGIDWGLRLFAPADPEAARAEQAGWSEDQLLKRTEMERSGVNPATILWDVKRDLVHEALLSFVLWKLRVHEIPRNHDGRVAGVDIVHSVQWCIVDDPPRLLFFANYDGTWEDYFNMFSAKAADRLNLIWGNTIGFPRTEGFRTGGAHDLERFRAATRMHQIPTTVWHSAFHRDLTLPRIRRNARLRDGLVADFTPEQAGHWVQQALS